MEINKYERIISLDDKPLLAMVREKGELIDKGRAISKRMEEIAAEHEKLNEELTALTATVTDKKLDIFKRVEKLAKTFLGEFEIPITTDIREGKLVLVVSNALDEFRDGFKRFDKWRQPVPTKEKKTA